MVRRTGFSLIEVTVAMLLLSVGLLGVAGTGLLAARLLREAEERAAMLERASSILDSLAANEVTGVGRFSSPRYQIEWTASASAIEVRTLMRDGSHYDLRTFR